MATSDETIAAIAKATGKTPEQIKQQMLANQSGSQFQPFALTNNADTGTLWTGYGVTSSPQDSGLPTAHGTKEYRVSWGGKQISVTAPNYGDGYKVRLNANIPGAKRGDAPTAAELKKADPKTQITIEILDKDNKVIYSEDVGAGAHPGPNASLVGPPSPNATPDVTQFLLGRGNQKDSGGLLELSVDPNRQVPGTVDEGTFGPGTHNNQTDKTTTVEDEMKGLYNLDPTIVKNFKHELWLAGYYGNVPLTAVNMANITGDDVTAFGQIMTNAARYYAAGKKVRWQDLLAMEAADPSAKNRGVVGTNPIVLTDPESITKGANDAATKILGRAPSPSDVQNLVAFIHGRETQIGQAQNANAGGTLEGADPQADIEQYMRDKYPNEAMAVDWGSAAQQWEALLSGTSQQPRTL